MEVFFSKPARGASTVVKRWHRNPKLRNALSPTSWQSETSKIFREAQPFESEITPASVTRSHLATERNCNLLQPWAKFDSASSLTRGHREMSNESSLWHLAAPTPTMPPSHPHASLFNCVQPDTSSCVRQPCTVCDILMQDWFVTCSQSLIFKVRSAKSRAQNA